MIEEARSKTISEILTTQSTKNENLKPGEHSRPKKLIIPPFQRDYKWKSKEVTQLIQDFCEEINWGKQSFKSYYIGAFVLCPTEESDSSYWVLDGQQRLTTVSLIMAAIVRIIKFKLKSNRDPNLSSLLYSGSLQRVTKIDLHEASAADGDQKVFQDIILTDEEMLQLEKHNEKRKGPKGDSKAMKTNVYKAYKAAEKSLLDKIEIDNGNLSNDKKVEILLLIAEAIKGLSVIYIETKSESDAFKLFETLNSRGLDLNAAELIKNKILQHSGAINLYSKKWKQMEQNCQLSSGKKNTVEFLRSWYNSEKKFIRKPDLYDEYALMIGKPGHLKLPSLEKFCDDLMESAEYYKAIIEPNRDTVMRGYVAGHQRTDIINSLQFIQCLGFVAMRPLLLSALKHRHNIALKVIKLAETLAVRNIGGNTNSLERPYSEAAIILSKSNKNTSDDAAYNEILKLLCPLMPTAGKIESNLEDYSFNKDTARAILERVDHEMRRESKNRKWLAYTPTNPMNLHIEHIYPVKPSQTCIVESGLELENAEEDGLIWRLGNLTLLEKDLNESIQNGPFSEKAKEYKNSEMLMTAKLPDEFTSWGEDEINKRTKSLASYIDKIWPNPRTDQ